MARKRGNSSKKSRSKRSSANTSSTTSPTPTPAPHLAAAETPVHMAADEPIEENPDSPAPAAKIQETADDIAEDGKPLLAPEHDTGAHPKTDDAQPDAAPETAEDNASEIEAVDGGKYSVDVLESMEIASCDTEDQLEDLYTRADTDPAQASKVSDVTDALPAEATSDPSHLVSGEPESTSNSVNLEDSEAVLLASNLEDSIYRSETSDKIADEIHAIEKSDLLHTSYEDEPEMIHHTDGIATSGNTSREYVITPSVFAAENEPDVVAHIRPESQATGDDATKVENTPAAVAATAEATAETSAAIASVLTSEIEAAAEAGERAAESMADSFLHVSKFLNDGKTVKAPGADASDAMPSREGSEQIERAVSEVMDSTKDAANKASDKARDAGNKANKAAKDAANATRDATDKASSRAKEAIDDASKHVKEAASNANSKAQSALSRAKESGERLAKKALDEANEAEKALEREARETSPVVLRTLGVVAAALAVVSGYYFRLPGRDNQRIGFAGGVASAIIGLGTLATTFLKRNS
ncbi:hypothetical protein H4S02_002928 [Coemansia sp. RSA 2611]|nr:hypothetical protein H4S02_002928 [Coemansia sp. RSA 2611]